MILEIISGNDKTTVEVPSSGGKQKIHLGGIELFCDWIRIDEGHYSIILDGNVLDVMTGIEDDQCIAASRTGSYLLRIVDPRRSGLLHRHEEGGAGLQRVCADMPGKIIRVIAKIGETVAYDQSLLVLEAMKMQNEIRAPKTGIVKEIAVVPGMTVKTGDFLVGIES